MTYSFEKGFETKVIMVVYLGIGMWPAGQEIASGSDHESGGALYGYVDRV